MADLRFPMPSSVVIALAVVALVLAMWAAWGRRILAISGLAAVLITSLALAFLAPALRIRPGDDFD